MCRYRGSLAGERDSLESCYLRKQRTCNSKVVTKVRNSLHYHHRCHDYCHHHYTLVIGRNTEIAKVVVATKGRCSIWFQWNLSLPKDKCSFRPRLFMCSTFPNVFLIPCVIHGVLKKHHYFPLPLHNYHLFALLSFCTIPRQHNGKILKMIDHK